MRARKWHRVGECTKTRKNKVSEWESCESQAEESEPYSAGNGEPKKASEQNDMTIAPNIDCT